MGRRDFFPSTSAWEFVRRQVAREFVQRHRGALLGRAWLVLQPAAQIAIYTFVFGRMMHGRLPGVSGTWAYSIFLCAGLLPWGWFAETLTRAQNGFFEQAHLIKKTPMPWLVPAIVGASVAALHFLMVFAMFLVFLVVVGQWPGMALLWALPVMLVQTLLALALGLAFGTLAVFFRDASQVTAIALQFGFWLTPIVYPIGVLPEWSRAWLVWLNPMAPIALWYQGVFLDGRVPQAALLWPSLAWTAVALALAAWLLSRFADEIVDLL